MTELNVTTQKKIKMKNKYLLYKINTFFFIIKLCTRKEMILENEYLLTKYYEKK